MIEEAVTITIAGLITRPGRSTPYRFEFVRLAGGTEELFLFRPRAGSKTEQWDLMSSSHGRAERDYLWQKYARRDDPVQTDEEEDEDEHA